MGEKLFDPTPVLHSAPEFSFTGFDTCREEFLDLFEKLTGDE